MSFHIIISKEYFIALVGWMFNVTMTIISKNLTQKMLMCRDVCCVTDWRQLETTVLSITGEVWRCRWFILVATRLSSSLLQIIVTPQYFRCFLQPQPANITSCSQSCSHITASHSWRQTVDLGLQCPASVLTADCPVRPIRGNYYS